MEMRNSECKHVAKCNVLLDPRHITKKLKKNCVVLTGSKLRKHRRKIKNCDAIIEVAEFQKRKRMQF